MNIYRDTLQTLKKLMTALSDPRIVEGVETLLEAERPIPTSSLSMALGQLGMADAPESIAPCWETDAPRPV